MKPVSLADISYEQGLRLLAMRKTALDRGTAQAMPAGQLSSADKLAPAVFSLLEKDAGWRENLSDWAGKNETLQGLSDWYGKNKALAHMLGGTGGGALLGGTYGALASKKHKLRNALIGATSGGAAGGALTAMLSPDVRAAIQGKVEEASKPDAAGDNSADPFEGGYTPPKPGDENVNPFQTPADNRSLGDDLRAAPNSITTEQRVANAIAAGTFELDPSNITPASVAEMDKLFGPGTGEQIKNQIAGGNFMGSPIAAAIEERYDTASMYDDPNATATMAGGVAGGTATAAAEALRRLDTLKDQKIITPANQKKFYEALMFGNREMQSRAINEISDAAADAGVASGRMLAAMEGDRQRFRGMGAPAPANASDAIRFGAMPGSPGGAGILPDHLSRFGDGENRHVLQRNIQAYNDAKRVYREAASSNILTPEVRNTYRAELERTKGVLDQNIAFMQKQLGGEAGVRDIYDRLYRQSPSGTKGPHNQAKNYKFEETKARRWDPHSSTNMADPVDRGWAATKKLGGSRLTQLLLGLTSAGALGYGASQGLENQQATQDRLNTAFWKAMDASQAPPPPAN